MQRVAAHRNAAAHGSLDAVNITSLRPILSSRHPVSARSCNSRGQTPIHCCGCGLSSQCCSTSSSHSCPTPSTPAHPAFTRRSVKRTSRHQHLLCTAATASPHSPTSSGPSPSLTQPHEPQSPSTSRQQPLASDLPPCTPPASSVAADPWADSSPSPAASAAPRTSHAPAPSPSTNPSPATATASSPSPLPRDPPFAQSRTSSAPPQAAAAVTTTASDFDFTTPMLKDSLPTSSPTVPPTPSAQTKPGPVTTVTTAAATAAPGPVSKPYTAPSFRSFSYNSAEQGQIKESWQALMRWSKVFRTRQTAGGTLQGTDKVVVFGGGSFGTAMGASLAGQRPDMEVVLLLRDPYLCLDINTKHCNTKYLKDFTLPLNMRATTSTSEAILGASYAVHAVPVQSSRVFLQGIRELLPTHVPIICVSKGLEMGTGAMMSEVISSALERKQPAVFLSGPSFAREVMLNRPTGVVAASKDVALARTVQALFASPSMRVNVTSDVVGVEICGALKNVLAIAAGIVEGLDLGNNALAALIVQGCSEIRWLAEKLGAKPTTIGGLSGLGDIMLTCYGDLSRNRAVGVRLGRGERIEDIIASSPQVAEGVTTAGVVVGLARKYRVSLPVLTAVAQVLDNNLTPSEAVDHIMNLPQIEDR